MNFDIEKVLLEIFDGDKEVLNENIDLIESGYLDSYAFILLFEAFEEAGLEISPTQIKKDDLRNIKRIKQLINNFNN